MSFRKEIFYIFLIRIQDTRKVKVLTAKAMKTSQPVSKLSFNFLEVAELIRFTVINWKIISTYAANIYCVI